MSVNLAVNGDFETGDLTGWTQSGDTSASGVFHSAARPPSAYGYDFGSTALGYIEQSIPTKAGAKYKLTLWYENRGGDTNEFHVYWKGVAIFDVVNQAADGWHQLTFTVTASGAASSLKFGALNPPDFIDLDDITITQSAPPPAPKPPPPCQTCGAALDCPPEDDYTYTLSGDPTYPYVPRCPNGFVCTGANSITLVCCSHNITRSTAGATTDAALSALVSDMLAECRQYQSECPNPPTCPSCGPGDPLDPTPVYYSITGTCTVYCPDGTPFTYYVRAGRFVGASQAGANAAARAYACQQAPLHRLCLSAPAGACSVDASLSLLITASGAYVDQTGNTNLWSEESGAVPTGLTLHTGFGGPTLLLDGTPSTPGVYAFTVKLLLANGDYMTKAYTLEVLASIAAGVSVSQVLTPPAGAGTSRVLSGNLPPGTHLGQDGSGNDVLLGTPTTPGTCTFTISYP